jgi:hypothetical protein
MTHNRCHSKYREFAEEVLEFLRETVPVRWSEFRDSVTDNFRVIDPRDFRVLKLSKYRYDYGQATPPRFALVGRYGAFDPR